MEIEVEIFLDDITEVELYSYLTFSEFSKTPQLLVSSASGVVSPKLIIFSSETRWETFKTNKKTNAELVKSPVLRRF